MAAPGYLKLGRKHQDVYIYIHRTLVLCSAYVNRTERVIEAWSQGSKGDEPPETDTWYTFDNPDRMMLV